MPSLRRSFSSPLVRSSPYPSSLSASATQVNAINRGETATATRPRRAASGSDTVRRRVLADIEWWRVMEGQQPEEPEIDEGHQQDTVPAALTDSPGSGSVVFYTSEQLLLNSVPVSEVIAGADFEASSLTTPFSAMTISMTSTPPLSPTRPRRVASDASDASDLSFESVDSIESTPISSPVDAFMDPLLLFPALENIKVDKHGLSLGLGRPADGSQMARSLSFGGFPSSRFFEDEDRFGDMVFL